MKNVERYTRGLAKFLALILMLSCLFQPGIEAHASAADADSGSGSRQEQTSGVQLKTATPSNASPEEEMEEEIEEEPEEIQEGSSGRTDRRGGVKIATPSNAQMGIAPNSLLPLTDVQATVDLTGYAWEALKEMKWQTVLSKLVDNDGNPIDIADDKVILVSWSDEDDQYEEIDRDGSVDLTQTGVEDKDNLFTMKLLVSSGAQLDYSAIRYEVTVHISPKEKEWTDHLTFYLTEDSDLSTGNITSSASLLYIESVSDISKIPETIVECYYSDHKETNSYKFAISSKYLRETEGVRINVYDMQTIRDKMDNLKIGANVSGLGDSIDNILNINDAAYDIGNAAKESNKNEFCVVYSQDGEIIAYQGLKFIVYNGSAVYDVLGGLYAYENGERVLAAERISRPKNTLNWIIKPDSENSSVNIDYQDIEYALNTQYSPEGTYYYAVNSTRVTKVEIGKRGGEDGMDDVEAIDNMSLGYPIDFGEGKRWVQLTLDDGSIFKHFIRVKEGTSSAAATYDPAPVAGGKDPNFHVDGCYSGPQEGFKNNQIEMLLDTYYGYGYQTLLISPDADMNLSEMYISFSPTNAIVYVGEEKQQSGQTSQNFSSGTPVEYRVQIGNTYKTYSVTVAEPENGSAKLFVYGPSEREIFLDAYFKYEHNILIANIGDQPLTGLKAELVEPQHVKLHEYWTVGGEGNNVLEAFKEGELFLAKITLVPDGEGEISGTLKISAEGQDDIYITLKGYSGDPVITTKELPGASKGVPYAYQIETSNQHSWNEVTYYLEEGRLPKGLNMENGMIYGTPEETGEFDIRVRASFSRDAFDDSFAEFTLTVANPSDDDGGSSSEGGSSSGGSSSEGGSSSGDSSSSSDTGGYTGDSWSWDGTGWRYRLLNGSALTNSWHQLPYNGSIDWYFFDEQGYMATGWLTYEGRTYYLNPEADGTRGRMCTGWMYLDGAWYYFNEESDGTRGAMLTAGWHYLPYNGIMDWYYFDENGQMKTGWITLDGERYYLNPVSDGTKGKMYTGWHLIDGEWYYFNEESDGTRGAMAANTWIDGHYVGAAGARVN